MSEYGAVTKEVISNYKSWLNYSQISEEDLLRFRFLRPINIVKERINSNDGSLCVSLIIGGKTVGERFVSPTPNCNESFMVDVSLILLYIAQRLDEANKRFPPIGFNKEDNEYFYITVKTYLKNNS